MRGSVIVSWSRPGSSRKPGAIQSTIHGEASIPANTTAPTTRRRSFSTRLASSQARSSPWRSSFCEKVETKAADKAPSAKRSRSKFGMRNAAMNASSSRLAPKRLVNTTSRTRPRIRLASTATLTPPAARPRLASALGRGSARIRFPLPGPDASSSTSVDATELRMIPARDAFRAHPDGHALDRLTPKHLADRRVVRAEVTRLNVREDVDTEVDVLEDFGTPADHQPAKLLVPRPRFGEQRDLGIASQIDDLLR